MVIQLINDLWLIAVNDIDSVATTQDTLKSFLRHQYQ